MMNIFLDSIVAHLLTHWEGEIYDPVGLYEVNRAVEHNKELLHDDLRKRLVLLHQEVIANRQHPVSPEWYTAYKVTIPKHAVKSATDPSLLRAAILEASDPFEVEDCQGLLAALYPAYALESLGLKNPYVSLVMAVEFGRQKDTERLVKIFEEWPASNLMYQHKLFLCKGWLGLEPWGAYPLYD